LQPNWILLLARPAHSTDTSCILDTTIVLALSKMYTDAIKLIGNTATLTEWDGRIPSFDEVHNEALKAKQIV
jgi:uncharacterized protein